MNTEKTLAHNIASFAGRLANAVASIRKWCWYVSENMPAELRAATLVLSERPVWTQKPLPLHGVPDQIYRLEDGALILVDSKIRERARVTLYDVVQLSVYRTILVYTRHPALAGHRVKPYAYIRCETGGRVQYLAVRLLPPKDVIQFAMAYLRDRQHAASLAEGLRKTG